MGNINCYDISKIYEIVRQISIKNNKDLFSSDPIIMKENIHYFNDLNINHLWKINAHNESIRHIHYIDIDPRIIVTTSYDLKIKIFSADNGKYKDEFRQIANRMKPVPIGIKYYILDPFGEMDNNSGEKFIYRKDILNFIPSPISGSNIPNISEVAKKITEYNAKEKLWLITKNTNLPENMSNDWKLDINIDKLKEKEENEIKDLLNRVKEVEKITKATESILLNNSIYSEIYKPKYIEEMKDINKIKDLGKNIQDRLRNVKLAVSKADSNYIQMMELTRKQKLEGQKLNNLMNKKKDYYRYNSAIFKNISFRTNMKTLNSGNSKKNIEHIDLTKNKIENVGKVIMKVK